jgi:hypothetical protein
MSPEQQQLEAGIAALEAQRAVLGDVVVDASIAGLRARLAALAAAAEPRPGTRAGPQAGQHPVPGRGGLHHAGQHLDPETVSAVLDGALARGTAVVRPTAARCCSTPATASWPPSAPTPAREDDAERAVHCGLACSTLGQVLGAEVQSGHGHAGFAFRVGIHTGGVLLGGGVDAERHDPRQPR